MGHLYRPDDGRVARGAPQAVHPSARAGDTAI